MARRKAGINPEALSRTMSNLDEPITGLKGPASEISGRVSSGETLPPPPVMPFAPGYNMDATEAQVRRDRTGPPPTTAGSSPYYAPNTRPQGPNEGGTRPNTPVQPATSSTSQPSTTQGTGSFVPPSAPQREQMIRNEMTRQGAVRRGPIEAQIDAKIESDRISSLPPPPTLPPPPQTRLGRVADWMEGKTDTMNTLLPAATVIGKSLITGRRISPNPNSEEARRVKGVSGMVQRDPIMTNNTYLYKNYPGMPQGGANQQQAPNGYTKNSVNGQTSPLPQFAAPRINNPGPVNMSTSTMPQSGAGQSAPQTGGLPSAHAQATAGVGGNPYLGPNAQHGTVINPTLGPAQPIRAPRQVSP